MADNYVTVRVFISGIVAVVTIISSIIGTFMWRLDDKIERMENQLIQYILNTPTRADIWTRQEQALYAESIDRRIRRLEERQ